MRSHSQSPMDPDFINDPYPFYDRVRVDGPLFHWQDYNLVCATSYDAVDTLLRDRRFGREQPDEFKTPPPVHLRPFFAFEHHSMLEREPPTHTRLRGLVVRAFTSRRIKALGPEIHALCHQLIDQFPAHPFDLLPAFAEQIPVIVIARLLGVPEEIAPQLLRWSHDMVAMYQANRSRGIEDAAVAATLEFSAFMQSYIDKRRSLPRDDLLSHLIAAEESGEKLTTDELISTAILLLNAGHEATVHAIGNAVNILLRSPAEIPANLAPDTMAATIEEALRFDPPLHMFTRYAYEDMEVLGHYFKRGDELGLLLAAANRDPAKYVNPNTFNPKRPIAPNTSFGAGLHFCIGAPLARLELTTALPVLFDRCPNIQLAGEPVYADRYHFHGLTQLLVKN